MSRLARGQRFLDRTVISGFASLILCFGCAPKIPPPTIGEVVQDFELADLDGELHRLTGYRGEVVIINFWATWCPPCRDELPSLERLHRTMKDKGVRILAVSVDERYDDLELMSESFQLSMTVLHDAGKRVSRLYQTFQFPETYIIDPNGVLRSKIIGPRDWVDPAVIRDLVKLSNQGDETGAVRTEGSESAALRQADNVVSAASSVSSAR